MSWLIGPFLVGPLLVLALALFYVCLAVAVGLFGGDEDEP